MYKLHSLFSTFELMPRACAAASRGRWNTCKQYGQRYRCKKRSYDQIAINSSAGSLPPSTPAAACPHAMSLHQHVAGAYLNPMPVLLGDAGACPILLKYTCLHAPNATQPDFGSVQLMQMPMCFGKRGWEVLTAGRLQQRYLDRTQVPWAMENKAEVSISIQLRLYEADAAPRR